jgi:hypothetical protein
MTMIRPWRVETNTASEGTTTDHDLLAASLVFVTVRDLPSLVGLDLGYFKTYNPCPIGYDSPFGSYRELSHRTQPAANPTKCYDSVLYKVWKGYPAALTAFQGPIFMA